MDAVYILGTGSKWNNNEIRYSLRSLDKFATGLDQVWIIGELPEFVQHINHIPLADASAYNREKNMFDKIIRACLEPRISDDFFFLNDDHFMLHDFRLDDFPNYHRGYIEPAFRLRPPGDAYRVSLKNTWEELKAAGKNTLHFDGHCPIVFNKEKFLQLQQYNWTRQYGFVIKSLYGNTFDIPPTYMDDCKIAGKLTVMDIVATIWGRPVFSIGDESLNPEMKALLNKLYHEKSRWEL